jgi:hypothetical protein
MRRLTTILAVAAATAAVPAAASAAPNPTPGEKPGNYGSCVAWEAMFGDAPVSEFIQRTSPAVTLGWNGEKTLGPKHPDPDQTTMACIIDFGAG